MKALQTKLAMAGRIDDNLDRQLATIEATVASWSPDGTEETKRAPNAKRSTALNVMR